MIIMELFPLCTHYICVMLACRWVGTQIGKCFAPCCGKLEDGKGGHERLDKDVIQTQPSGGG